MPINIQNQDKKIENSKLELKNNNSSYEKSSWEFFNNSFMKYSLGCIGMGSTALVIKLIYDKIHENQVKLNNIKKFILKNFFVSKWERNSCWNDVFIQHLMCPEYRCKKFKSPKINAVIKKINDFLGEKYDGDVLKRYKLFKSNERPIPDGLESWLTDGKGHYCLATASDYEYDKLNLIDLGIFDQMGNSGLLRGDVENFFPIATEEKVNSYLFQFINLDDNDKRFINKIFSPKSKGYYPTFIAIFDDVHYKKLPHFFAYYIIYDKNKMPYFILADGLKNSMKILSKEQGLKELQQYSRFYVKYLSEEIVNEFYTLEEKVI